MQTLDAAPAAPAASSPANERDRAAWVTGIAAGVATFLWLLLGVHRAYDLDDSLAVGLFIATPSIADAFTKAYVLNNHVFFSFLDHLVYTVTGSQSEPVMRLLPVTFAAGSVGLLAGLLTRRWGRTAGLVAAVVLATNPMFADVGSQVRGYSFVVLLSVATTALLLRALERDDPSPARRIAYGVLAALGVATHLYMLVVMAVHAVIALANRRVWRAWIPAWLAGLLGLVAYSWIWREMRTTADQAGHRFRGGFPLDLSVALLGGTLVAAAVMLVIVGPVLWRARHSRLVQLGALGIASAVVVIWFIGPFDLYPRFFLWLAPLPAIGVAAAVKQRRGPWVVVAVAVLVVLQVWIAWPRVTQDPYASRTVRDVFDRVAAAKQIPCVMDDYAGLRLTGYTDAYAVATSARGLRACAVVVLLAPPSSRSSQSVKDANAEFGHRATLPARHDATLWSRAPTSCWLSDRPPPQPACPASAR